MSIDKKTEQAIEFLDALDEADFSKIEKLVNSGACRFDRSTQSENWNWLHSTLMDFNKEMPPRESININTLSRKVLMLMLRIAIA